MVQFWPVVRASIELEFFGRLKRNSIIRRVLDIPSASET